MVSPRTLALFCPDWPVTAAGHDQEERVVVVEQQRVVASSRGARRVGIVVGQRRREAESRCAGLVVRHRDQGLELRAFEPVLAALEGFGAPVTAVDPGCSLLLTRGPARYFGGEPSFVDLVGRAVASCCSHGEEERAGQNWARGSWWGIGIADGSFAAIQAARKGAIVAPKKSAEFLAPLPIALVGDSDLTDLLGRLGISTLGDFARLDEGDVLSRFGTNGAFKHRLARGGEGIVLSPRRKREDLVAEIALDPPVERVEVAVFIARSLTEVLSSQLFSAGLSCTVVEIAAETTRGECLSRQWSHDATLSPSLIAERLRAQIEFWIGAKSATEPIDEREEAISRVRLVARETTPAVGRQLELTGSVGRDPAAVERVLARVQGMVGVERVSFPMRTGGRGPAEQIRLVHFGEGARVDDKDKPPWPGRLPAPSPTVVFSEPTAALFLDKGGEPVAVNGRGEVSSPPAAISIGGETPCEVVRWAGPWPVEERWWDARARRRRARFQLLLANGEAYLVVLEKGRLFLEGRYG